MAFRASQSKIFCLIIAMIVISINLSASLVATAESWARDFIFKYSLVITISSINDLTLEKLFTNRQRVAYGQVPGQLGAQNMREL